jgi:hypothetical protein
MKILNKMFNDRNLVKMLEDYWKERLRFLMKRYKPLRVSYDNRHFSLGQHITSYALSSVDPVSKTVVIFTMDNGEVVIYNIIYDSEDSIKIVRVKSPYNNEGSPNRVPLNDVLSVVDQKLYVCRDSVEVWDLVIS